MRKYLIDNEIVFAEYGLEDYIKEKYRLKGKEVKVCWFNACYEKKEIYSHMYFELRSDLKGPFDYSILRRETVEVVDFISENFSIRRDLVRIYFNGKDGFYLVIPSFATGLFHINNISEGLKKLAEYIKLNVGCKNLRLDIYELDSYHIEFNEENKSTGLFLVNLSPELVMKYTYKELINYASNKSEKRFFGTVNYRVTNAPPSILEVIGEIDEEIDFEKWIDNYTPLQVGINKEAVKEFYLMCETVEKHRGLLEEAKGYCNYMLLESNRFEGEYKKRFLREMNYDLIIMLLNYLYVSDSKYQMYMLREQVIPGYKDMVICEVNESGVNIILYLDTFIIGNEEISIRVDDIEDMSSEELIEVIATVYKYLESTYER